MGKKQRLLSKIAACLLILIVFVLTLNSSFLSASASNRTYGNNNWDTSRNQENGFKATNQYMIGIAESDKIQLYYHFKNNNLIKRNATNIWVGAWVDRFDCMWDFSDDLYVNNSDLHSGSTGDPSAVDTGFAVSWQGVEIATYGTEEITFTLDVIKAQDKYTVKYDGNGATSGYTADMKCKYNEAFTISANGYSKTGYTFTGWNTEKNLTADNPGSRLRIYELNFHSSFLRQVFY